MIEHVVLYNDNVMQRNVIPSRHPQRPVPEWTKHFHHELDDSPFILCDEEWPVITVFWILEPLGGEFS